jgi:hypothetical protein
MDLSVGNYPVTLHNVRYSDRHSGDSADTDCAGH